MEDKLRKGKGNMGNWKRRLPLVVLLVLTLAMPTVDSLADDAPGIQLVEYPVYENSPITFRAKGNGRDNLILRVFKIRDDETRTLRTWINLEVFQGWKEYTPEILTLQAGDYCMTVSHYWNEDPNSVQPDMTHFDQNTDAMVWFTVLPQPKLASPSFSVSGITDEAGSNAFLAGGDLTVQATFPEHAVTMEIVVGKVIAGEGDTEDIEIFLDENYTRQNGQNDITIQIPGFHLLDAGKYRVSLTALSYDPAEADEGAYRDSDPGSVDITVKAGTGDTLQPVVTAPESFDYVSGATIHYSVQDGSGNEAEAVACKYTIYHPVTGEELETALPSVLGTGSEGDINVYSPGRYEITFWGLFDSIWSQPSETISVNVIPEGYLGIPTVTTSDGEPVGKTLILENGDDQIVRASCECAEGIVLEIMRQGEDPEEYLYEGRIYESILEEEAVFDLDLAPGIYRLTLTGEREGWLTMGSAVISLTILPEYDSGECGDNLYWMMSGSTLRIVGEGEMDDYGEDSAPWAEEYVYEAEIQEGVTRIGDAAFRNMNSLSEVWLPSTLTEIGMYAFAGTRLSEINTASGAETSERVFYLWNSSFQQGQAVCVELPDGVSAAGSAFLDTNLPQEVPDFVLPDSTETLEVYALENTAAVYVWLPDSLLTIESGAFQNCADLKFVRIPNSVISLESGAFPEDTILLVEAGSLGEQYAQQNEYDYSPLIGKPDH